MDFNETFSKHDLNSLEKKKLVTNGKYVPLAQNTRCNEKPLLILELAKLSATIFDYGALFGGVKVKNKLK